MRKMRKIIFKLFAIIVIVAGFFASCDLDNYEAPNAELSGSFIDVETQELVQQDIIRGTQVRLTEHEYDPVANQYLNAKPDGTYTDKLLFAGTYTVQPERGNFLPVEEQEIVIEGKTRLDFVVTPYIRIIDASIVKSGSKIIATFKLQQNVENNVSRIGLYGHPNPIAGQPIKIVSAEKAINTVVDPDEIFTLEIDIESNNVLEEGNQYFFRAGAVIDVPEAKFNYAPAVRLAI
jgi:hypothetical protein